MLSKRVRYSDRTGYKKRLKSRFFCLIAIMVTVYVIRSVKDGSRYTGMALNATIRLKEHNAGKNRYTKGYRPWEIVYTEVHPDWKLARVREKYLKSAAGRNWLDKYLNSL